MRGVVVAQSHVERTEDVDKDKKKKRRSNRRSKQNSFVSVSSSVNELHEEKSEIFRFAGTSNEQALPRASNVAFNSLPTMHIIEHGASHEDRSVHEQQLVASGAKMFSRSFPDTITGEESTESCATKYFLLYHQRKYFTPHWSPSAINEALEKGYLFKALFRVNAHNRLEAYCKIDGVHTDVLINGVAAQNRAIEGDIVVIKVDPLSSWAKMKGSAGNINSSAGNINSSAALDDYNSSSEVSETVVGDGCKGKIKPDTLYECVDDRNDSLSSDGGIFYEGGSSFVATVGSEVVGCFASGFDNCCSPAGRYSLELDPPQAGCSSEHNSVASPVEKLCAMLSTFPSKRPTGRVVTIIQMSPRREAVVGFLNVKQYLSSREVCKKENKKKKNLCANQEYIMLTSTDPRLPKMMVLVTDLPDFIRKRLEEGDMTLEMELVAARIDHWEEENYVPQARVMHIFGRGGEIEPRIAAILFENAIFSSEFSCESLSCLPCLPWEVPVQELKSRRDLRNLCIFTIDPSTATDLDDALSVERLSNGIFRVGVHIADVSYFVLPDTELDREAQIRSTSVYLLRSKIPMLPSLLSENLGSLNPGVDRLAFSIFWDINLAGEVLDRWIGRTVIRSCCKLSYENAQDIIDGLFDVGSSTTSGDGCPQLHGDFGWSDIVVSVQILNGISKILKEKRFNEGALRLESSKLVLLLDEYGTPYDSMLSERKDANFLVEEFMLLANRTAAEVTSRAYPDNALLRRHPEPNLRKLREFEAFCSKHGLKLDTSSSGQLHQSLEQIGEMLKNDTELFNILVSFASKPMQLATYFCSSNLKGSENDWRHYALAVPVYTHFTSPLRRYADIVVHRKLAATLDAEEMYLKRKHTSQKLNSVKELTTQCFTGICFDKDAAESIEGREALSVAASKHTPCTEVLADVAAYSNERKLASRNVKDASDRLYMWFLLKKKEIFLTEARVLGLGPRFMSIYVQKFAIERRIYYDEIEDLKVEWLDITSTLVLNLSTQKRFQRRGSPGKSSRAIEEVALVTSPLELALGFPDGCAEGRAEVVVGATSGVASVDSKATVSDGGEIEPAVFPLTVRLLSKVPVALHAIGGDDGALDIGARLYVSSYLMMMR
ncbi:DIS3-like exonuclease 2 isoform X2 [Diospyros lotus]|uniref:DIS3-like exonuclease 2 isoform X2 n=1 Tax=Diospyros lotus TaxID=55363 RepID=UPI002254128F|nr:DIS3-like exonuclease 2 isoform X2 [Diospyros lotus]